MLDHRLLFHSEQDLEANGEGLLLVDLLSLPNTFSWRRYKVDLVGLLLAAVFVALLMLVLLAISWILGG